MVAAASYLLSGRSRGEEGLRFGPVLGISLGLSSALAESEMHTASSGKHGPVRDTRLYAQPKLEPALQSVLCVEQPGQFSGDLHGMTADSIVVLNRSGRQAEQGNSMYLIRIAVTMTILTQFRVLLLCR